MKSKNILKSLMVFVFIGGPVVTTSCSDDDDTKTVVVSFENQKLNEDGFWMGDENATGTTDSWGGTTYNCSYIEQDMIFKTTYTKSDWGVSFMGFGISNSAHKEFSLDNITVGQFYINNNAYSGNQYAVVYGQNATLEVSKGAGVDIKGLYFINTLYVVSSIWYGDSYAKKFETGDFLKVTITADNGKSVDFYPVDFRKEKTIVVDWTWLDLSSLGRVKSLTFTFDGTDKGEFGVNTPLYVCIDDLTSVTE